MNNKSIIKEKPIEVDIEQLRDSVNSTLVESGWDKMLSIFVNGLDFDYIVNNLVDCVNAGKRFTPKFKDIFNAFKECPYDDLKVVIVGQDPYPQLGVADGIAFSCSNKGKAEKSLQYINKALGTDHTDLKYWANQGVLLINTALTVQINSIGSHYNLWKPFTSYLFDTINKVKPDTIFVLMGNKAQEWKVLIPNCTKIKCSHPASAAYRGGDWDHNDVFNKVNKELKKQGRVCINW
jgi:uracil-DNA glycosylase